MSKEKKRKCESISQCLKPDIRPLSGGRALESSCTHKLLSTRSKTHPTLGGTRTVSVSYTYWHYHSYTTTRSHYCSCALLATSVSGR